MDFVIPRHASAARRWQQKEKRRGESSGARKEVTIANRQNYVWSCFIPLVAKSRNEDQVPFLSLALICIYCYGCRRFIEVCF